MDEHIRQWKRAIDRLWQAPAPDCGEAARLVAEIAAAEDTTLRQAATQALPGLRHASATSASRGAGDAAWRRLGPVRDVLYTLTAPRFGKRGVPQKPLTPEERYRQMLGLPFGRRLAGAEIHQAYKRAAKTLHPDVGGNDHAFHDLAAARDALMKPDRANGG